MSTSTPIVAVIGCGKRGNDKEGWAIGHAHAEGWLKAAPLARLCGVDILASNLKAFGERFELPAGQLFSSTDDLYESLKPDFVSICTWPALHAPMVIDAASRGVTGIICEKPLALDAGEMQQMRSACAKSETHLAIAHQRRYEPAFQLARSLLAGGAIGDVQCIEARVSDGWDILSWTVHWFDIANFLFNSTPHSIIAGGDYTRHRRYQQAVENASIVLAEYPGDKQAIFVTGPPGEYSINVRGSKGVLQLDGEQLRLWNENGYSTPRPDARDFPGAFARLCEEMLVARTNANILCNIENCYAATEMAYAAHESIRTRRKVSLPLDVQFAPLEILARESKPVFPFKNMLLFADEHFGSGGREGLADALTSLSGSRPTMVDAGSTLQSDMLRGVDLLVQYHTQKEPSDITRYTLLDWVNSGKPMLLVHAALGAYPDWDEYCKWCGRVWDWGESEHPHEPSEITPISSKFAAGWDEAWLPRDEVFIKLGERSEVEDLAHVQISAGSYPAAWLSRGKRNIGVWVPGHRKDMWSLPVMREGLAAVARSIASQR